MGGQKHKYRCGKCKHETYFYQIVSGIKCRSGMNCDGIYMRAD